MTTQEGLVVIFSLKKFHHYLLGYKTKIVTDCKALTYLVNESNPSGQLVQWLLLMEEFDIDIVDCPRRRHSNVDGFTKPYEGIGDVSKDDDFPNVALMTINVIPIGATKVVRTQIAHKSRNYFIIGN